MAAAFRKQYEKEYEMFKQNQNAGRAVGQSRFKNRSNRSSQQKLPKLNAKNYLSIPILATKDEP